MEPTDRDFLNLKHAKEPMIGDYWNEMCSPVCVVVDVSAFAVIVCEKTKETDDNCWTWDHSVLETYTRDSFSNRFRYGSTRRGDFVGTDDLSNIENKFWCDVSPQKHTWVRELLMPHESNRQSSAPPSRLKKVKYTVEFVVNDSVDINQGLAKEISDFIEGQWDEPMSIFGDVHAVETKCMSIDYITDPEELEKIMKKS